MKKSEYGIPHPFLEHPHTPGTLASKVRAYEVLPETRSEPGVVTVVAFKRLRASSFNRTTEAAAARHAARGRGRNWTVTEGQRRGFDAVFVSVPAGDLPRMRQSLDSKGFSEGTTP